MRSGARFTKYLFGDMRLAIFSLALVVVILLVNTQSVVLTLAGRYKYTVYGIKYKWYSMKCEVFVTRVGKKTNKKIVRTPFAGLFEIVWSLPLAMFGWMVIGQVPYARYYILCTLYSVLCTKHSTVYTLCFTP